MFAISRGSTRVLSAIAVLACSDGNGLTDPEAGAAAAPPLLMLGQTPTEEEFAEMPAEFRTAATILAASTKVGFSDIGKYAWAQGYMKYFATDGAQEVELTLRFENSEVTSTTARGARSDPLPYPRELSTVARLGVSGTCGHLADGTTEHSAHHQFITSGSKYLAWSGRTVPTSDSKEQPACPPPAVPPDTVVRTGTTTGGGGGGDGDGYDGSCYTCQQWFLVIGEIILAEWWECESASCGIWAT